MARTEDAVRRLFIHRRQLAGAVDFGGLVIVVTGALVITSEYGTRMMGTSLTAMPRRGVLYAAKAIVLGCVTLVDSLVMSFAPFFAGQAALDPRTRVRASRARGRCARCC